MAVTEEEGQNEEMKRELLQLQSRWLNKLGYFFQVCSSSSTPPNSYNKAIRKGILYARRLTSNRELDKAEATDLFHTIVLNCNALMTHVLEIPTISDSTCTYFTPLKTWSTGLQHELERRLQAQRDGGHQSSRRTGGNGLFLI